MLTSLIQNYLNEIIALLAFLIGLFAYGAKQRSKGRDAENARQKEIDNDTAKDIRDRVRAHKSDGLQPDELKYRD